MSFRAKKLLFRAKFRKPATFGFRRGESGELIPHEGEQQAIRDMAALRAQGRPLRAIAEALRAKGFRISHEGVKGVLRAQRA